MRVIVIGDVHGCAAALWMLLNSLAPRPEDHIVMLGDLFDRGPDSYDVYQIVRQLAEERGERFTLLRGNHEDFLLSPRLSLFQKMTWERVGRSATVRSFAANGEHMEDAVPWLTDHCRLYWKGENLQCVHAGLRTDPIEANDRMTMIHDHHAALRNVYSGPFTVVGHVAMDAPTWFAGDEKTTRTFSYRSWQPLPERGTLCIDTGCGKGGWLSALVAEEKQFCLMRTD